MSTLNPNFDRDKFFINQKHLSLKGKYYVYDEQGAELFYVERPFRLFARRDITVFGDDSKREPLLFINQDKYWELFHRNYTVVDPSDQVIAKLFRNNFTSLFRRGWDIKEPSGTPVARAREDSLLLAIVRRILGFIIGGILKTDFHFLALYGLGNERKIGAFNRRFTISDKYVLDLSEDRE